MFDDREFGPVGLEDEKAFEASVVLGAQCDQIGDETVLLPDHGDSSEEPRPGWVGKTLGHFKLLRKIAEGSMGIVIQAIDVNLERIVALKVLRKRIVGFDERQRVDQFLREARAAARLDHPNVVRIYEINEHDGWWHIAMEMVEGGSVKQILQATGGMAPGRACPVIADAAVALAAAHSMGIVHRDVKPGNLMVSRGGHCKLTDFGLVRLYDPNDPFDFTTKAVGTPQYVAPEVIRQHRSTAASDVYSLGGTFYYSLTGHPPYVGDKVSKLLHQHLEGPLPELSKHIPDCPESLNKLVQWAMAKDPADRPTAADFATALRSEAIDWRGDESGSLSGISAGSSVFGHRVIGDASIALKSAALPDLRSTLKRQIWMLGVCGAMLLVIALLLWMQFGPRGKVIDPVGPGPGADISGLFPDSPATYGVLPPGGGIAGEPPAAEAPPFSWVGKHDTVGLRFVASKRGRRFYPVNHPDAQLIRSEDFVGYKSEAEALADDKIPVVR